MFILNFLSAIALYSYGSYFSRTIQDTMKRRYRRALNVLSLGLLVFALYLNFLRKESAEVSAPAIKQNSNQLQDDQAKQTSCNFSAGHSVTVKLR